ncbi:MAG: hypothetical protein ACYCSZ_13485 [Burkholderiales bacterium]
MVNSQIPKFTPPLGGIHISRGVRLRIPVGGLVIHTGSAHGQSIEVKAVELQLDTCVHWLEIAMEHLANAGLAHEALCVGPTNCTEPGNILDREFKASIQAIFAAATFFEALYAATIERFPPKKPLAPRDPKKRSTRYAIVTEQLRRSFGLKNQGTANLRSVLREVYHFRDQAVHPSAVFSEPVLHPELNVGVEKRFVMFSASNAQQLVRAALAFSQILPSNHLTRQSKDIQDLGAYLLAVCFPLYALWERRYGPLLDTPSNAN